MDNKPINTSQVSTGEQTVESTGISGKEPTVKPPVSQLNVSNALKANTSTMGVAGIMNKINKMDTDIENKKNQALIRW